MQEANLKIEENDKQNAELKIIESNHTQNEPEKQLDNANHNFIKNSEVEDINKISDLNAPLIENQNATSEVEQKAELSLNAQPKIMNIAADSFNAENSENQAAQ